MLKQKVIFESGNELAAFAAKQIDYDIMGYYPITPSTQIAEELDLMVSQGECRTKMIAAEGEHSAAGICYGASAGGGRVLNATSANGLLYAIEQLPVQSGTRLPMVMNVACRTVSGPLSIKGDHSDIMFALNVGWVVLFATDNQQVYDFNIIGIKLAEKVKLPVIIAYDGFFTSHQKKKAFVFENICDVKNFIGEYKPAYTTLDFDNPITIGSYMNEPDLINNKYQLHIAMEDAKIQLRNINCEYEKICKRSYEFVPEYMTEDAQVLMFALGSTYDTIKVAVDKLRQEGKKVGAFTFSVIRPFPKNELIEAVKNAKIIIVLDRQDSYGARGGNMSLEIKASLQEINEKIKVITRIYGIGGLDFFADDAMELFNIGFESLNGKKEKTFDYLGVYKGDSSYKINPIFKAVTKEDMLNLIDSDIDIKNKKVNIKIAPIKEFTSVPKRVAQGHGACPGCGIPVNINLLLKGINTETVLLMQTGCGMVVTTSYPKTAFKINYVHNLFQNGAATLSGLLEMYEEKVKRKEIKNKEVTFIMISGDGGLDIGLGSALATAIRNHKMIIFEYDNGGYMNTGYQLSYSTPLGAKSATSHIGLAESGKKFMQKDNPQLFAATGIPYVATVAESNPQDFIKKAAKAQEYARNFGLAYIKSLSACPLNWGDNPRYEREIIGLGVDCCYHPLYEVENGITTINYDPEKINKKIPIEKWLCKMGRTKHLIEEKNLDILKSIQAEVDKRWRRLKARAESEYL